MTTMRRAHYRYELWEDWQAGLYAVRTCGDEAALQAASGVLLGDPDDFGRVAWEMVRAWPIAAEVALTHTSSNRQAWVGQATCCYAHAAPDYVTKRAWWDLNDTAKDAANATADSVIDRWEGTYRNAETLFG